MKDTPETDSHLGSLANAPDDTCAWLEIGIPRKLERERDAARKQLREEQQLHVLTLNERDELIKAIRNLRKVEGRYHTEQAARHLYSLLP